MSRKRCFCNLYICVCNTTYSERLWAAFASMFYKSQCVFTEMKASVSGTCRDNLHIDVLIPSLPPSCTLKHCRPTSHYGFTFSFWFLASHSEKRPQQRARNAVEATTQTEEEKGWRDMSGGLRRRFISKKCDCKWRVGLAFLRHREPMTAREMAVALRKRLPM